MDNFAKLIDSRIEQKTKNQFMKTQPATVINNGSVDQMKVVRLLATGATAELLNMTGVDLSVGDQVQVYSCGKTMYIGASSNTATGTIYTAGDNITISAENVISSHDTTYTAGENISISSGNVISSYLHAQNVIGITSDGGSSSTGFDYIINVTRPAAWSGWLVTVTLSDIYTGILNEIRSLTFFGNGAMLKRASYAYIPEYSAENGSDVYDYSGVVAYMYRDGTSSLKLHIEPRYYTVNGGVKNYELAPAIGIATIVCFN